MFAAAMCHSSPTPYGEGVERLRVDRSSGLLGESVQVTRLPGGSLRGQVRRYIGYREETAFRRRREPPSGAVTLIIDLGDGLTVLDPMDVERRRHIRLSDFVAGPNDHPCLIDSGGRQTGVQIDLTLLGARLLLNRPLREIANQIVTFDDLFGAAGRRLVERLRAARSWEARFTLLDKEFQTWSAAAEPAPADIEWAWRAMDHSRGRRSIAALADELGYSRKYLTDRFAAQLGLPPKTMASVVRFRHALDELRRDDSSTVAELAAATGYYDQAHLNRDFRRFAGITPTEHRRLYTPEFGLRAE